MAESDPTLSTTPGSSWGLVTEGNDGHERPTPYAKRSRWGTTPFPIPTATMSLEEESTLRASEKDNATLSPITSNDQPPIMKSETNLGDNIGKLLRRLSILLTREYILFSPCIARSYLLFNFNGCKFFMIQRPSEKRLF